MTTSMTLVLLTTVVMLAIPATTAQAEEEVYCKENLTISELIDSGNGLTWI